MAAPLAELVAALERIAPPELAEPWDNVGLVIDVPEATDVRHCTLTIDFSEPVLEEALANGSQAVVAYHPPMFQAVRRLSARVTHERVILRAIRAGLALYSPHTALDAAPDGVNDWLGSAFGDAEVRPIPATDPEATALGREVRLAEPFSIQRCVDVIKRHLGLDHVRVATAPGHETGEPVRSIALCAGAGASVIGGQRTDLYWTGEMRHHDVLAALERGTSVVLCDHTNTERGYLPTLRAKLESACPNVVFAIATTDREPLSVS